MKTLLLSTILLLGTAAYAEGHEALQINFNEEIDANTQQAKVLTNDMAMAMSDQNLGKVDQEAAPVAKAEEDKTEKVKVSNFVDFEVQATGNAKVAEKQPADRRFN